MHINDLPTDLAQFVREALMSGQYPSAEALVCEALHLLREQTQHHGVPTHPDEARADSSQHSPEDYLHALAHALRTGEFGRARQLATEGVARYPKDAELAKSAHVLAPPTVRRARRPHTAAIQANRTWLKTHRQDYAGQWVALRNGHLLAAAPSFDQFVAHVDETHDVLMTKIPA